MSPTTHRPPATRSAPPTAPAVRRGHLNLHLHQLAYLVEVERSPTLTEAARRLGVSQPALSQSLAEMERRLGLALFERSGRHRTLTDAGVELTRFATEVLGRAAQVEDWLTAHRAGEAGTLRVGMIDAASLYVLPETIRDFRSEHPSVRLSVTVDTSTVLLASLASFALDLVIVIGPVEEAYEADELLSEPLYLYGPSSHSGRGAADGHDGDWGLYPAGSQTRGLIDSGLARAGIRPNVTLESGNPQVLRQLVALGLGWSVLPAAVAEVGEQPLLRAIELPIAERAVCAARRLRAPLNPRAEAFLELARRSSGQPSA